MKQFLITQNDADQRLDRFLKKLFINASKSLIYKLNRKGKVKVNTKKLDNEYKLQLGDEVRIYITDSEYDTLTQTQPKLTSSFQKAFDTSTIIYEDGDILVVNKDPGINVHPGDHKTKESDLITQVKDYLGENLTSLTFAPSLIHRIDRDTSGIVMIAKNKQTLLSLSKDFKNYKVKKVYKTLVWGNIKPEKGEIFDKILRLEHAKNQNKVQIDPGGLSAHTKYKVISSYTLSTPNGEEHISEVEVEIITGRMHQIRVHMSHIGHSVVGDDTYGDKKLNAYIARHMGLSRQALHAWRVEFFHPSKQKMMQLEAREKKDYQEFIKNLHKI